jgi:hypothetical protein
MQGPGQRQPRCPLVLTSLPPGPPARTPPPQPPEELRALRHPADPSPHQALTPLVLTNLPVGLPQPTAQSKHPAIRVMINNTYQRKSGLFCRSRDGVFALMPGVSF